MRKKISYISIFPELFKAGVYFQLKEIDKAIEIYKQIFQREEGKKKWDAQRSIKFVNKLKRKQAIGALPAIAPANPATSTDPLV